MNKEIVAILYRKDAECGEQSSVNLGLAQNAHSSLVLLK